MKRTNRVIAGVVLTLILMSGFAFAQQPRQMELVLPDEAMGHVYISSVDDLLTKIDVLMKNIGQKGYDVKDIHNGLARMIGCKDLFGIDTKKPIQFLLVHPMKMRRSPITIFEYFDRDAALNSLRHKFRPVDGIKDMYELFYEYTYDDGKGDTPKTRQYPQGFIFFDGKHAIIADSAQAAKAVAVQMKKDWYRIKAGHLIQFDFDFFNARRILQSLAKQMPQRPGADEIMGIFNFFDKMLSQFDKMTVYGDIGAQGISVKFAISPSQRSRLALVMAKQRPEKMKLLECLPAETFMAFAVQGDFREAGEFFKQIYDPNGPIMKGMLSSMPPEAKDKFKNILNDVSTMVVKSFENMPREIVAGILPAPPGVERKLPFSLVEYFRGFDAVKMRATIGEMTGKLNNMFKGNLPGPLAKLSVTYEKSIAVHNGFEIDKVSIKLPELEDKELDRNMRRSIEMMHKIFGGEISYYFAMKDDVGIVAFGREPMGGIRAAIDGYIAPTSGLLKKQIYQNSAGVFPEKKNVLLYLSLADLVKSFSTIVPPHMTVPDEIKNYQATGAAAMAMQIKNGNLIGGVYVTYAQIQDMVRHIAVMEKARRDRWDVRKEERKKAEKMPDRVPREGREIK